MTPVVVLGTVIVGALLSIPITLRYLLKKDMHKPENERGERKKGS